MNSYFLLVVLVIWFILVIIAVSLILYVEVDIKKNTPSSITSIDGVMIRDNNIQVKDADIVKVSALNKLQKYTNYLGKPEDDFVKKYGAGGVNTIEGVPVSRTYNVNLFGGKHSLTIIMDSGNLISDIEISLNGSLKEWKGYFERKLRCDLTVIDTDNGTVYGWEQDNCRCFLREGDEEGVISLIINQGGQNEGERL